MPDNHPDDPAALKQLLAQMQSKVALLEEENALLRQRLFGRKSEQTVDPMTPQLPLFNEAEVSPRQCPLMLRKKLSPRPNAVANASLYPLTCHESKSSTNSPNTN